MEKNLKQLKLASNSTVLRIAIFGPESTGKTTLAKQLAEHYQTSWVPEFARNYLQDKLKTSAQLCDEKDMLPIAYGQVELENKMVLEAKKFLFCDTNLMVTKVFSEVYYKRCDPFLDAAAKTHAYDLFFLTDVDVPWEADDLRDSPNGRTEMFSIFKQSLLDNNKPFITLRGDVATRFEQAITILDDLRIAKTNKINSQDFIQLYQHGLSMKKVQGMLTKFKKGISKTFIDRPATVDDGIVQLSTEEFVEKARYFEQHNTELTLMKFVPASGAATRMFKFLNEFLNNFDLESESINAYINRNEDAELSLFLVGKEKFPFYAAIETRLKDDFEDFESWPLDQKDYFFIKYLLSSDYFNFGNKPKGVLPFHDYTSHIATPFEEHVKECIAYSTIGAIGNLHFTISPSHQSLFDTLEKEVTTLCQTKNKITIAYSFQSNVTDSITVDAKNQLIRNVDQKVVFRPGGHGALIENLNALQADLIFIKNIDNVIYNQIETISLYKKALAGILLALQKRVFEYCNCLQTKTISTETLREIVAFVEDELHIVITKGFSKYTFENKVLELISVLNRPIRVCGMVKNEGEPGGGPFWVIDRNGN
ncbi:MAG: DUF4301 family protein, partial [Flavobacterium sp.]